MRKHIGARRGPTGDNFTSELIRCELDGMVTPEEMISVAMSLLMVSMDNTMHPIALTFGLILEDPERWQTIPPKPLLATQAAEESFRLLPRFGTITRHASHGITVNGFTIPAGSWIFVSRRSAGPDAAKHQNADEFRFDRPPSRTLQFGGYYYNCLGATLP